MVKVKSPVALVVKVKSDAKKKQYCIETRNVRSMNPGKLDMIKQEMLRGFSGGTNGKEPASQCRRHKRCRFVPWVGKIP